MTITKIEGLSTNEKKEALIKKGFDIICPQCRNHWGSGEIRLSNKCSKCGYSWRVDTHGHPLAVLLEDGLPVYPCRCEEIHRGDYAQET